MFADAEIESFSLKIVYSITDFRPLRSQKTRPFELFNITYAIINTITQFSTPVLISKSINVRYE